MTSSVAVIDGDDVTVVDPTIEPTETTVRVYQYGLLPPTEGADTVRELFYLAWKHRVNLRQIESWRREAEWPVREKHGSIEALEAEVKVADERTLIAARAIKAVRQAQRSRKDVAPELLAEYEAAKAALKEIKGRLYAARQATREDPEIKAAKDTISEKALELVRGARAYSGMAKRGPYVGAFGTYHLAEAAASASNKVPMYDGVQRQYPKRVHRFDGSGSIGVSIDGVIPSAEIVGGRHKDIQIDSVDPRGWSSPSRSERRLHSRTVLRLRTHTSDEGEPVYATFPMIMHRPLPEGSSVTRAAVHCTRIGPRSRWTLTLTVKIPLDGDTPIVPVGQRRPRATSGKVAVDLGWRVIEGERRVATWRSNTGESGELRLPARLLGSLDWPDTLRSHRDTAFNRAREILLYWLRGRTDLPVWLSEARQYMHAWRSPLKLAKLARYWRDHRFQDDGLAYEWIESWRYHDHHMWEYESSQREKALGHRRQVYLQFVRDLACRFGEVIIEDWDMSQTARLPDVGSTATDLPQARANRQKSAVSDLRTALLLAFGSEGMPTKGSKVGIWQSSIIVDPSDSTHICPEHGTVEEFDAAENLSHTYGCGCTWDQDEAAARVLLTRGERLSANQTPGVARKSQNGNDPENVKESRSQRIQRQRREKVARMTARSQ